MKYVFLEANKQPGLIVTELRAAVEKQGHQSARIRVLDEVGELINRIELSMLLDIEKPDRIIWQGGIGYPFYSLLTNQTWTKVPKIVLCYDEPFNIFIGTKFENDWKDSGSRDDFFIGIWDGYWRDRTYSRWGFKTFACHLAVNEFEHMPETKQNNKGVIFYGMLQSVKAIRFTYKNLPVNLQKIVQGLDNTLERYDSLSLKGAEVEAPRCGEEAIEAFADGDEVEKAPAHHQRALRWVAWAMLKNSFRVQVLRKLLMKTPVIMFSDTVQCNHASEPEIGAMLSMGVCNLTVVNTSNWSVAELRDIPNMGHVHIQATDPQSVAGGIPYRMFQTAACGKCLLTDSKPELEQAFKRDEEFAAYHNASDVVGALYILEAFEGHTLATGESARQRFLEEHTWTHRVNEFEDWIISRKPQWEKEQIALQDMKNLNSMTAKKFVAPPKKTQTSLQVDPFDFSFKTLNP